MTRTLFLLRHAKSSWDDPTLEDFDRPLAKRGREAAPLMGREMARRGWLPDLALVSAALRTRQTWDLVAPEFSREIAVTFDETIYEAPVERILAAIRKVPAEIATLVVVGHNPGFENLAGMLAAPESNHEAMAAMQEKFPTAALARFSCAGEWAGSGWTGLGPGGGILTDFLTPRGLGR